MYSSGFFEKALIQFHKMNRLRGSNTYDDWIGRCEETIKAFLSASHIDVETVEGVFIIVKTRLEFTITENAFCILFHNTSAKL